MEEKKFALQKVADRLSIKPQELKTAICKTVAPDIKTEPQFLTFIAIANSYKLNPLRGEITAFPSRGGVKTIVPIDGWISIVNKQSNFDGVELIENKGEKNISGTDLESVTARFYLKDKSHPIVVTEYLSECYNGSKSPWKQWPRRMLRHKAYIQGARVAFGLSGIYDEDEVERIKESETIQKAETIQEPKSKSEKETKSTPDSSRIPSDEPEEPKPTETPPKEEKSVTEESEEESADEVMPTADEGTGEDQELKDAKAKILEHPIDDIKALLKQFGLKSTNDIKNKNLASVMLKTLEGYHNE